MLCEYPLTLPLTCTNVFLVFLNLVPPRRSLSRQWLRERGFGNLVSLAYGLVIDTNTFRLVNTRRAVANTSLWLACRHCRHGSRSLVKLGVYVVAAVD